MESGRPSDLCVRGRRTRTAISARIRADSVTACPSTTRGDYITRICIGHLAVSGLRLTAMDSRKLTIINTYLIIALIALTIVLIVLTIVVARDARRLDVLTHSLIGQPSSPPPEQSPSPTPTAEPVLKAIPIATPTPNPTPSPSAQPAGTRHRHSRRHR